MIKGPIEQPGAGGEFETLVRLELQKVDFIRDRYDRTLEHARAHTEQSICAAALVGIEESNHFSSPVERIQQAKVATETARQWESFILDNPDEMMFATTEYQAYTMRTRAAELARHNESLVMIAPFQEAAWMHGGKLHLVQGEIDSPDVPTGGYEMVTLQLKDIVLDVKSAVDVRMPPLIIGRENIASMVSALALEESKLGLNENRLKSLPYVAWLTGRKDVALAKMLDDAVDEYGMVDSWRAQLEREIGAKVAYAIKDIQKKGSLGRRVLELTGLFRGDLISRELAALEPSTETLILSAKKQCERAHVDADIEDIVQALETVTGKLKE